MVNLTAQNPGVVGILVPGGQVFANQGTPFIVVVDNQSTEPAFGTIVQVQVFDQNNIPVFNWQTILPVIAPFQELSVNSQPAQWTPNPPGPYTVVVNLFAEADEDPSNNNLAQPVQVVPQPPFSFRQVDMENPYQIPNSTYGEFCITFPTLPDPLFINAMAQDPLGTGIDWVVRNLPILPFDEPQTLCYWFDLGLLGFEEGDDVNELEVAIRLDPLTLSAPFPVQQWQLMTLDDVIFNVQSNNASETPAVPPVTVTFPTFDNVQQLTWLYRGCTVPNIELDSSAHPPTPTYAGDWNACGPASAANSMQWLEDTHPEIHPNGLTHRQKMESLSGHMGRADTSGVTTEQLVQGKLGYIDEHKLPIHVKYQSFFVTDSTLASPNGSYGHSAENKGGIAAQTPPTWEFLKSEMEKGEDVEIMFGWYDKMANRHGGHWVTVTGVSENTNFKGIYIKDDEDQETGSGTRQKYLNWHTDGDWSRLLGFDGPNNYCWVESVVSESYDPNVTFDVFNFSLENISWVDPFFEPDLTKAFFNFSFPPSPDTNFLNILANLPDSSEYWIARNVLLPPRDSIESVSLWWDLADLGLLPNQSVDSVRVKLGVASTYTVDSFFDITYSIGLPVQSTQYIVGNGALESTPDVLIFTLPPLPDFDVAIPTTFVYRGCEMPNVDLDSTANNPVTMPGYAGDKNACGPAAAANSLQWLEDTHPLIPSSGTDLREKLKELSEMMNRANNGGVLRRDFIEAKLEFIDKYKLPIHVKFQGFRFDANNIPSPDTLYGHSADNQNDTAFAKVQWDWLVQEMENGEDVELEFGYYDSLGVRRGGHWITVTGVTEIAGIRTVYFKDDTRQTTSGGMRHECTQWVGHPSGHSYLKDLSGNRYTCWVETVVSESYDPDITFCPTALHLDQDPIPPGTYEAFQEIIISGRIAAGSDVVFSAPSIRVDGNFLVEQGATMTTNAAGCQQ